MTVGWLERLSDADRRTDNAWLLTAVLVVALVCAGETLGALASGTMPVVDATCVFAVVAATMLMAFRPVTGALAVTASWIALSVAAVDMPSAMLLSVLTAIGILGYAYRRAATAIAVAALGVWICTQGGISWTSSSGTFDSNDHVLLGVVAMSGVAPVVVLFVGSLLGGMAVRWNHERHSERMELAYRRQRTRAAQDIHDYVSNDLAYLILRLDKNIADGKRPGVDELRELRDVAAGALDRTHQVIRVIEGDARRSPSSDGVWPAADHDGQASVHGTAPDRADGTVAMPAMRPSSVPSHGIDVDCPLAAQLRAIARSGDHRLAELGFDGQTIVTNANDDAAQDELVAGLLEELYGNIAKHADPAGGYVLTIGIGRDAVQIALVDMASIAADPNHVSSDKDLPSGVSRSLGTGIARYRARIAERGGTLNVSAPVSRIDALTHGTGAREWTLVGMIPLIG